MPQSALVRDPTGLVSGPVDIESNYERVGAFQIDAEHLDFLSAVNRKIISLV
jgi:hypothetical protein